MCGAELLTRRAVHSVVDMPLHRFDASTWAHMFHPPLQALIDPFLGVDAFCMPENFFLPHPHGGMSAITLLLDVSPGGVLNRDSLGDHSTIAPGDLHWTQAGRGMVHEETPSQPGLAAVGLQVFVNMARARKQDPAAVFKVARADMPVWQQAGARVTVVAGSFQGMTSTLASDPRWATPVDMLDIRLDAGATLDMPVSSRSNGFLLVLSGSLQANGHDAHAHQAVVLQPALASGSATATATAAESAISATAATSVTSVTAIAGATGATSAVAVEAVNRASAQGVVSLQAGDQGAHVVLMAGVPLREPVVPHGPFVGNSREDIVAYIQAYQAGRMGELAPSFSR